MKFTKWFAIGLGIVALLCAAGPSHASGRDLAVLVVGSATDRDMTAHERAIIDQLTRLRVQRGWNHKLLPIYSYHFDKSAERSYCEERLKVRSSDLIVVGLVELDSGVPVDFVYRENDVKSAAPVADKVIERAKTELAARGRLAPAEASTPANRPTSPVASRPAPNRTPLAANVKTSATPAPSVAAKPSASPRATATPRAAATPKHVAAHTEKPVKKAKPASATVSKAKSKDGVVKSAAPKSNSVTAKASPTKSAKKAAAVKPSPKRTPAAAHAPSTSKSTAARKSTTTAPIAVSTAPSKPVVKPAPPRPAVSSRPVPVTVKPAVSSKPVAVQPLPANVNERWAIQVGLFSSLDKARTMVEKLKGANLQSEVRKGLKDGVLVYRVVVGDFSSQAAAYTQAKSMQESGVAGFSVRTDALGQVVK